MHIQVCQIQLHENLFYATREIGRLYETGRYLHNYGLTYALGFVSSPYFCEKAIPRYQSDLSPLNDAMIYVTPAHPCHLSYELNTFKYANNNYRVKMGQSKRNTPSFGRAKEVSVGSTFRFAVLSKEPQCIPKWIRLGKWMSKAAVTVTLSESVERIKHSEFTSGFPLNPLDISQSHRIGAYDLISMPPVSLLDNAFLEGAYYEMSDGSCVPVDLAYRFPE